MDHLQRRVYRIGYARDDKIGPSINAAVGRLSFRGVHGGCVAAEVLARSVVLERTWVWPVWNIAHLDSDRRDRIRWKALRPPALAHVCLVLLQPRTQVT